MYLKLIQISKVETAKNGNKYQVAKFEEIAAYQDVPGYGMISVPTGALPKTRVVWEDQDIAFGKEVDFIMQGRIKTFDVDPYDIVDKKTGETRKVDIATIVQFGHESDGMALKRAGKTVAKRTAGFISADDRAKAAVAVEEPELSN